MYEYIQNTMIEYSLKTVIIGVCYVFFFTTSIFSHLNIYYFEEFVNIQEDPEDESFDLYNKSAIDCGEIGNIGWEYEYQDCLTTVYNYFFENPINLSRKYELIDNDNHNDNQKQEVSPLTVPYPDKYKEQWKKREPYFKPKEQVDEKALKNNVLFENTPFGNVIMYYDSDKSSFIYYSDKTLSYPIINSVGRKYSLTFGCECLYRDETIQQENKQPLQNQQTEQPKPSVTDDKKSVYAKFKNYKKPQTNNSTATNNSASNEQNEEKINRYTCEGKLANFSILKKVPKIKPFSYKDFKNKMVSEKNNSL